MPSKSPTNPDPKPKSRQTAPRAATAAERKAQRQAARTPPPGWKDPLAPQQPLVAGRWLLYSVLAVVGLAAVCAYLTLCLLFYQGQWQVVFHPSRTITATPASVGLKYDEVRFDYTGTGTAQLAGWWIPAESNAASPDPVVANSTRTILFLHDGKGSLSDITAQLKTLHSLGVNLFAIDYRGFGQSMNTHPSETRVYEDADAAWNYLTDIRHLDPKSIVLYGTGLGATIAAETALRHRESPALVPALILENPAPPALGLIAADERTSILPIRWLFRDRFEIGPKLQTLGIELSPAVQALVLNGKAAPSAEIVRQEKPNQDAPNSLILLGPVTSDPHYLPALRDFLAAL
jgi:pimeloyl-ACP methyl ester carboxylesterase